MLFLSVALVLLGSCSASKFVPDEEYMLEKVEIKSNSKEIDPQLLRQYIRQNPNTRWFSLFKIPMGTYALSGRDTTKWINRTLRNIGEEPVLFDSAKAVQSVADLRTALQSMGYVHARVKLDTKVKGKKLKATYTLMPGEPFYIRSMEYIVDDPEIARILDIRNPEKQGLKAGMRLDAANLDNERSRITNILTNNGYYHFYKDFILFEADSMSQVNDVNLRLRILQYRQNSKSEPTDHPRYQIRNLNYLGEGGAEIPLRRKVLEENTYIVTGRPYSSDNLQRTYNKFGRLGAVRYTNIRFTEVPDTTLLDCDIQISTKAPNTISFQPEGTNTAGDLGAAATLSYENRNLFRGSELLTIQARGAFEAITGLEGYSDSDYTEYSIGAQLQFPHFMVPFVPKDYKRRINATSEVAVQYDLQNRPEFHRRVLTAAWRYRWNNPQKKSTYQLDLPDINYVRMPWISSTFRVEYLDNVSSRNAILRFNYEDLFITKIGFRWNYNNGSYAIRTNIETSGNVLNAVSHILGNSPNGQGSYTLFGIAYAQYVKGDFDYTKLVTIDRHNSFAMHFGLGIAYPYGNSTILPFEKRYFSGGANSVRGWSVRELGPGSYKSSDGRIYFVNQTGDMKLDINFEYRTWLFWKLGAAAFIDAGNIWTLREYKDQPGGQFRFDEFYKQIAVSYGLGLRLNFDYFILRFDAGMKAVNPAYDTEEEHWAVIHPRFKRDFSFHFAVGLPF